MQIIVSLPNWDAIEPGGGIEQVLFRTVSEIPLLARVIATAITSGGSEVILLNPRSLSEIQLRTRLDSSLPFSIPIRAVELERAFDPDNPYDWQQIEGLLESRFLWLPWNLVADTKLLSRLIAAGEISQNGVRFCWPRSSGQHSGGEATSTEGEFLSAPAVVLKEKLGIAEGSDGRLPAKCGGLTRYLADSALEVIAVPRAPGVVVYSSRTARQAERELVRRSGKESDGIYSRFNRWLSRPAVCLLARTPFTPNMVTFGGLAVAVLSAYWFSKGYWSAYVLGALLFFVSVLFDEMDGMLARITFRDSAFGTWLESFVDYASYILMFLGMTIGLYRQSGVRWLALGGLLLVGTLASFFVLSRQRKLATDPDRPQDYRIRLHQRLESDKGNLVSRFARQVEFLIRKPAACHFIIIFTVLGAIKVLFLIAVFGANLVWPLVLYFNRFFSRPVVQVATAMKGASEA